jgi:hypothetical protein
MQEPSRFEARPERRVRLPFRRHSGRRADDDRVERRPIWLAPMLLLSIALLASGCVGGGTPSAQDSQQTTTEQVSGTASTPAPASNPLVAEAQQAAAGDIPDNQVFLTFRNRAEGYSIEYPEGWAQRGSTRRVTFRDKNNLVRIEIVGGSKATVAAAAGEMARLRRRAPSLRFEQPVRTTAHGKPVVKVVYATKSATNPVTGKRVVLVVDRYYVAGPGKHAVVDLGTPQGVDNVDAYRLMIESFRWR